MKKLLALMIVVIAFTATPVVARASTIGELVSMVESLRKEVSELRQQLGGQTSGSALVGGIVTPLKFGSTGAEVSALQTFLTEKGFYSGNIDGIYGWGTDSALAAYKTSIGFQTFGKFGGSWRIAGESTTSYTVTTSACKADFDGSGKVQVADYVLLQNNFSISPTEDQLLYDIKVDGVVDIRDVKEWMTQYGKTNFCTASNTTTQQWLASITGTPVAAPAASAVPSGSDWTPARVGATSSTAWLWDYQVIKILNYTRKQMNVWDGSGTPNKVWVTEPMSSSNVTLLAQMFAGNFDSIENNNGKLYLVQNASFTSYTGNQYEIVRKYELYKPTVAENQTTSIDVVYEKVGSQLENKMYINKKPIASYNNVFPKFFTYFGTDAKWMMTMRVLNDGEIENTSILGVYDNAPESAYTFETVADSRLIDGVNIVEGSASFNPTSAQDYYNPTTNTITLEADKGQVVWFHFFMKPPSFFPTGFTGISETKTYGTDFAINLQRNTAVIRNGDFVSLSQQGL